MPDERFATDKRHLHRPVRANQVEHAADERIAVQIVDLPECDSSSKVHRLIGVTARTMQRAFTGDFNR